jgi:hypothetical protein
MCACATRGMCSLGTETKKGHGFRYLHTILIVQSTTQLKDLPLTLLALGRTSCLPPWRLGWSVTPARVAARHATYRPMPKALHALSRSLANVHGHELGNKQKFLKSRTKVFYYLISWKFSSK